MLFPGPTRLDLTRSVTGLILALFMWGHMLFVSSILLGKDAMWTITKFFEGYFFKVPRQLPAWPQPRMQANELEEADGMTVFIALNEIREHRRPGGRVIQAGSASAGCNRQGD